jgi:hypothetical protein
MRFPKFIPTSVASVVAIGVFLATPCAIGFGQADAKPPTTIRHCKVTVTTHHPGHEACTTTNQDQGGGNDPNLNPDNYGPDRPANSPVYGTPEQRNQCFYGCTHGDGHFDQNTCEQSCYGHGN